MLEIREDTINKVEAILDGIPRGAERAFTNAINRALHSAKSEAYKSVTEEYAIKKKVLAEYTKDTIKKASKNNICGTIIFSGKQIPLYKYTLTSPKKSPSKSIVYSGQKTRQAFEHAFITTMQNSHNSHIGIFEREKNTRYPLRELMGSSMRSMLSNKNVMATIYQKANEKLDERLEHEIARLLRSYKI